MHKLIACLSSFVLLMLAAAQVAANIHDAEKHEIHYNAVPTDHLAPSVASAYGIIRSKTRAMLNIAVLRKNEDGTRTPVTAVVNVHAANLSGQVKPLKLRQINEDEAIYYIGELPVADGETLIFDVYVTPASEEQTHHIRFQKRFFAD